MPRIRTLKPDFWSDKRMVKLSPFARLFYMGCWNFAICERGHLADDAEELKLKILPADDVDGEELLDELLTAGRILRMRTAAGETYLWAHKLTDHQKVDGRWQPRCPFCAAESRGAVSKVPPPGPRPTTPDHTGPPADSPNLPEPPRNSAQEGKGREGKGKESGVAASVSNHRPHERTREEPPPDDDAEPGPAEQILTEWVATLKRPPQKRIANAIGIIVQAALGEGQDPDDVRDALKRWQAKGNLGPAVLPSIIHEVANGPRPGTDLALARASPNGDPQRSTKGRAFDRGRALADQLRAEEAERAAQ